MAFGITIPTGNTNALQSRSVAGACQEATLIDADGKLLEKHTYGANISVSVDYYLKSGQTFSNTATDGQSGTSVITNCTLNESNSDYQRVTETYSVCGSTVPSGI